MRKTDVPAVTVLDVIEAYPPLPMPLSVRAQLYPAKASPGKVFACVEIVFFDQRGAAHTWQRWGREVRADNNAACLSALLLAAQECWLFCERKDPKELIKLAAWQLDKTR